MPKKSFDPVRGSKASLKAQSLLTSNGVDEELYKRIPINRLILFSIYSVIESKDKCVFERLIKECFALFPKSFAFSNFPKWPDSRKLDRSLRSLRKKKMITGSPKTFFSLTKLGKKSAEEIARNFRQRRLQI